MSDFSTLLDKAASITDPRINRTKKHNLADMVVIAVYAVICGADGWEDIEFIAKARKDFLGKYLSLENGIPHHDTFRRVFSRINEQQLIRALNEWSQALNESLAGKVVAIDGKTLRNSFDTASSKSALHSITAFVCDSNTVLAQVFGDNKQSEITQDVELLKSIDITGAIVTSDAMGCQKRIAEQIVKGNKADYLLACKDNQPTLRRLLEDMFSSPMPHLSESDCRDVDKGHGRIETRTCRCLDVSALHNEEFTAWQKLRTIAKISSVRDTTAGQSSDIRYYISSLPCDAKKILKAVRSHWRIENSLHWVLDAVFHEDDSRIRRDHGPANFASLRRTALSLIKNHMSSLNNPIVKTCRKARMAAILNANNADRLFTGLEF